MQNRWSFFSILLILLSTLFLFFSQKDSTDADAVFIDFYKPIDDAYVYENDSLPEGNVLCKTVLKNETYYFESFNAVRFNYQPKYLPLKVHMGHNKFFISYTCYSEYPLDHLNRFENYENSEKMIVDLLYIFEEVLKHNKYIELDISWVGTSKENKENVLIPIMNFIKKKQNEFSYKKYKKPYERLTQEERRAKDFVIDVNVFKIAPPPPPIKTPSTF